MSSVPPQRVVPLFQMGRICATPGALAALLASGEGPIGFLMRHVTGDWGDLVEEDSSANVRALAENARLLSVYRTRLDVKLYIITEWDRSVTTILLPEDY